MLEVVRHEKGWRQAEMSSKIPWMVMNVVSIMAELFQTSAPHQLLSKAAVLKDAGPFPQH